MIYFCSLSPLINVMYMLSPDWDSKVVDEIKSMKNMQEKNVKFMMDKLSQLDTIKVLAERVTCVESAFDRTVTHFNKESKKADAYYTKCINHFQNITETATKAVTESLNEVIAQVRGQEETISTLLKFRDDATANLVYYQYFCDAYDSFV